MARLGRRKGIPLPRVPGLGRRGSSTSSPLRFPKVDRITQESFQPYPPPSGKMIGRPITEWVVYDDLTRRRNFREGYDFLYQVAIPAPGLLRSRGFNRADFWILPSGRNGSPGGAFARGLILNPYSTFTHPEPSKDRLERAILASALFLEIYLEETALLASPHYLVGMALRGVDLSGR